ncbi:MAG: hypothetical protein EZS26_002808 [Candidatus Ordinivivax streblomastigis]|uniref:Peptidase M28 domain-containing protein n=1 Tax=Candidatus Ordinivivax streblomastigis TaxID=2540710 RepID=A0A5M8NX33_9BACT|nr:MAG: hypothetical protein EZS26_002808 [Candidatus Ordinivivax streblomastigis]
MTNKIFLIIAILVFGFSCKPNQTENFKVLQKGFVPELDADSAYHYTAQQVAFGPRVPNTPAHQACGNYLADELRRFGAEVIEQETTLYTYKQQAIHSKNIIASFQPENKNRVLLCAHWDSRPFADQDPNPVNHKHAIDGANDGAGACGLLLEIARQIGLQSTTTGIDIILFDAEDWGTPEFEQEIYGSQGWCLGSQYWAQHPHIPNYSARFGILLDMVSAPNAQFYKEYFSMRNAQRIVTKVWATAEVLGYNQYFINQEGPAITDDHNEIFKYRHIPCIDIIQTDANDNHRFGTYWHTLNDNMQAVSTETMKAVGQVVLSVIYNEK